MDHHLNTLSRTPSFANRSATPFAGNAFKPSASVANIAAASRQLKAGQAVTLRAKELGVLRIAHGRVWATMTDVGPYSRVTGGDHFLSRGESLTLLPGQELVMESFGMGHSATALFHWEDACAAAIAVAGLDVAANTNTNTKVGGVAQPLRDLHHALGLVAGASGRLVSGLVHGTVAAIKVLPVKIAMIFAATRTRKTWAGSTFNATNGPASAPLTDCRSL